MLSALPRIPTLYVLTYLVFVSPLPLAYAAPAPPSNPGTQVISSTEIRFYWTDNATDEDGFNVGTASGANIDYWQSFYEVNKTEYRDQNVCPGSTVKYSVSAFNASGNSAATALVSATTPADKPLTAPTQLLVTPSYNAATSTARMALFWNDNVCNETSFEIQRSPNSATSFAFLATVPANTTSYYDTTAAAGTLYYYQVRPANANGNGNFSPAASGQITSVPAVANFRATLESTTQIFLYWTDSSDLESGYGLERSTSQTSGFSQIAATAVNVTNYTDTPGAQGTYYYRVRGLNPTLGNSPYSSTVAITLGTPSATPSGLTVAQDQTNAVLHLSWTDNSNNSSGTIIQRGTTGTSGPFSDLFTKSGALSPGYFTFDDRVPSPTTTYYYRVYIFNAFGDSPPSNAASGNLSGTSQSPVPPSNFRVLP